MGGISKAMTRALQLGIKEVFKPHFTCYSIDTFTPPDDKLFGYRCVWPSTAKNGNGTKIIPTRFGKLAYISSFLLHNASQPDHTALQRTTYLTWEGKIARGGKYAKAFDADVDGKLDAILFQASPKNQTTFKYENGVWYRDPLGQKEEASVFEFTEMILPAQEAYTNALILGGLLLLSPKLEIKELF